MFDMQQSIFNNFLIPVCLAVLGVGCSSVPERNPLPEQLRDKAEIPNIEHARYWADEAPPETEQ